MTPEARNKCTQIDRAAIEDNKLLLENIVFCFNHGYAIKIVTAREDRECRSAMDLCGLKWASGTSYLSKSLWIEKTIFIRPDRGLWNPGMFDRDDHRRSQWVYFKDIREKNIEVLIALEKMKQEIWN